MSKKVKVLAILLSMLSPAAAGSAEFEVKCKHTPTMPPLNLVWTNTTTTIAAFDRSDSPFSIAAIDDLSVTIRNDLGTEVVFKDNRLIYSGSVESEECELKIISTELALSTTVSTRDFLQRIEDLERRVADLEKR